jgi:hypothetical protein
MNSQTQVFISYASRDEGIALEFRMLLGEAGIVAFCAKNDLKAGDDWQESIRKSLKECSEIIFLVAPESVQSDWVLFELGAAWILGKRITPILLHGTLDLLPDALKRFHCVSVQTAGGWQALIAEIAQRHNNGGMESKSERATVQPTQEAQYEPNEAGTAILLFFAKDDRDPYQDSAVRHLREEGFSQLVVDDAMSDLSKYGFISCSKSKPSQPFPVCRLLEKGRKYLLSRNLGS